MTVSINGTTGYAGPLGAITVDTGSIVANAVTPAKMSRTGTSGQVLTSGGAGADPSYQNLPAGGVTSITAGTGLTGGTITTTGTIALDVYNGSTANYSTYPIGTNIMCQRSGNAFTFAVSNNAAAPTIYSAPSSGSYTFSTTSPGGGAVALAGTWRGRGIAYFAGSCCAYTGYTLVQRTA